MTTERCWLVDRDVDQRNLVALTYATPDGERAHRTERSTTLLARDPPTAAVEVEAADLEPVADSDTRERYAAEVERVRERHDPDDEI